jgi:cyclopropane fatty-acyl-phospholipid synthase-like methyltransferase
MRCEICAGEAFHDFSKTFDAFGLGRVEYWRCRDCGFVLSRTHAELSPEAFARMNDLCHSTYQGQEANDLDPRWKSRLAAQAQALADLAGAGLLAPDGRWLDFGCGDGGLSTLLKAGHGLTLLKYDEYMGQGNDYLSAGDLEGRAFDMVITTSVFEHLTRRAQWDRIEALVAPSGALAIHTLVAEHVPSDPSWFYLQPPHSAFFSNAAMDRLFRDWGYSCSIYNVGASLWVWFRGDPADVARRVERLNARRPDTPFLFKAGFLDYWKSEPRRTETQDA